MLNYSSHALGKTLKSKRKLVKYVRELIRRKGNWIALHSGKERDGKYLFYGNLSGIRFKIIWYIRNSSGPRTIYFISLVFSSGPRNISFNICVMSFHKCLSIPQR